MFFWIVTLSLLKYGQFKTAFQKKTFKVDEILYPSISFCRKWTFDYYIDDFLVDPNNSLSDKQDRVSSISWRNPFYFLSHPGMLGLTFPCATTLGGTDPAKLCDFSCEPYNCSTEGSQRAYCYTRVREDCDWDYESVEEDWGYCSDNCRGEVPEPRSPYNLATREDIWTSSFYDLRTWDAGLCYTYDPPSKSRTDLTARLIALIGNKNYSNSVTSFDIYLHDRGQFWPRAGLEVTKLSLSKGVEVEGSFGVSHVQPLGMEGACSTSTTYSLTSCLSSYVHQTTGCSFTNSSLSCTSQEALHTYYHLLVTMKTMSMEELHTSTGCPPLCHYTR